MLILVDYVDIDGNDYFQVFKTAKGVTKKEAMLMLSLELKLKGYTPMMFTVPKFNISFKKFQKSVSSNRNIDLKKYDIYITDPLIVKLENLIN